MNFNTARDIAHLDAFSHAMAARDEMNNRPVSLADFGGAKMFGEELGWEAAGSSGGGSSFTWNDATGLITAATQGTAAIIGALEGPGTQVYVGATQPQYSTPGMAINPQTGMPYGYSRPGGADNMMMYLALGGVALVALMFLTKKKSAPAAG